MNKFNVGDRVVVITDIWDNSTLIQKGKRGTVEVIGVGGVGYEGWISVNLDTEGIRFIYMLDQVSLLLSEDIMFDEFDLDDIELAEIIMEDLK